MRVVTEETYDICYIGAFEMVICGRYGGSPCISVSDSEGEYNIVSQNISFGTPLNKARQIGYNLLRKYLTNISNECWVKERQLDKELV